MAGLARNSMIASCTPQDRMAGDVGELEMKSIKVVKEFQSFLFTFCTRPPRNILLRIYFTQIA